MSPLDYMMAPLKRYADFSGRARRMEYCMFYLFNIIVYGIIILLINIFGDSPISVEGLATAFALTYILLIIPGLSVTCRRLHDLDTSGWWVLITFLPLIGIITIVALMFLKGRSGDNRYGPDPKESAA